MSSRPPAPPPVLAGFEPVRHLGSGGFADVYLYEERLLGRRNVAVKVLLKGELMAESLASFTNESTLMAKLSTHPSIVSVYQAGVSEDGRPFIVMEYCSRPNLQARYLASRFSEAETLRIGIQIAGAIETAHRAGIVHRDIKPANILITDYGRPALTDFGIAATVASGAQAAFSVPWAPPESIESEQMGDERSDIYSLAATLYTLLAGRAPYELPGASNATRDLIGRMQTSPLPPIGRADVSQSMERTLANAMSRSPGDRPRSAMAFARELQRVQIERGMQPTTVDVLDEATDGPDRIEDDGRTVVRSIVTIDAQPRRSGVEHPGVGRPGIELRAASQQPSQRRPSPAQVSQPVVHSTPTGPAASNAAASVPGRPVWDDRALDYGAVDGGTQLRSPGWSGTGSPLGLGAGNAAPVPPLTPVPRKRRPKWPLIAGAAVMLAIGAGIAAAKLLPEPQPEAPRLPSASSRPVDLSPQSGIVPKVTHLRGRYVAGEARFTWTNPDPQTGDKYIWRRVEPGKQHPAAITDQASVAFAAAKKSAGLCIEVSLRRTNGAGSAEPAQACVK